MGLDITTYQGLTFVETLSSYDEYEEKYPYPTDTVTFYGDDFPDRAKPIIVDRTDGIAVYRYAACDGFAAGSYSGYNDWREKLSFMTTGLNPRTIWANRERYRSVPFYLLIDFSDCEGTIGTDAAKVLAQQFAEWQTKADQHSDEWFRRKYQQWRSAFEMAADNGAVRFH